MACNTGLVMQNCYLHSWVRWAVLPYLQSRNKLLQLHWTFDLTHSLCYFFPTYYKSRLQCILTQPLPIVTKHLINEVCYSPTGPTQSILAQQPKGQFSPALFLEEHCYLSAPEKGVLSTVNLPKACGENSYLVLPLLPKDSGQLLLQFYSSNQCSLRNRILERVKDSSCSLTTQEILCVNPLTLFQVLLTNEDQTHNLGISGCFFIRTSYPEWACWVF